MNQIRTKLKSTQADYVFEVSWEACNKVGGIYTVLKSKAKQMVDYYSQNYYLIGPYFPENLKGEFQEQALSKELLKTFSQLEKQGIKCHFGKWLVKGEPKMILIDFQGFWPNLNQIKTGLWEKYKIDSLGAGYDFDEPVVWSYAVGIFIEEISRLLKGKKVVAHFHEWLSGAGLLYLKRSKSKNKIGTVFTTHATVLGRTLAHHNVDFYSILHKIEPEKEIIRYNIKSKHQLEKVVAQNCDVFTTVSEITGLETKCFFGRKPDVLLFNGLDAEQFLALEEIGVKHRIQRNRLREFLLYYFFPYYAFDLKETFFYFILGRYEFRAKGLDIFIKALANLNEKLIKSKSKKTIVAFFWIPAGTKDINQNLLKNQRFFQDVKDSLEEVSRETEEKILQAIIEGKKITEEVLFEKNFLFEIKKKLLRLKRKGLPCLSTHDLAYSNDPILKAFQEAGLNNKKQDKVKVVFYPIYLTGHDGLSDLSCQESIQACNLGVFPSFYEPWGYTPLEAAALGVSSVTTDLAGFGRFCQKLDKTKKQAGVFVLKRFAKTDQEEIQLLADFLERFSRFSPQERAENEIQALKIAAQADWKVFIKNYIKAHNLAI